MNKLALAVGVVVGLLFYLRSPIDILPDRMGAVGLLDDLLAVAIAAWWFWKRLPTVHATAGPTRDVGGDTTAGPFDPHAVLGLSRGASREEIRRAYHDQLRQYHPDRVDGLGEEIQKVAHARTLDIRRAYEELTRS